MSADLVDLAEWREKRKAYDDREEVALFARYCAGRIWGAESLQARTARVTVDHWRDECLKRGMPKQRFYDAKESLLERGEIHIEHGFVR